MGTYTKIKSVSKAQIDEIRNKVDFQLYFDKKVVPAMPDYYSRSGDLAFVGGASGVARCPLQAEDTPSLHLRTWETGLTTFKCFSCDKGGDIIKFHMYFMEAHEDRKINYTEAANELYKEFIEGRIATHVVTGNKIRLTSDVEVKLSTLSEITKFTITLNKYENFLKVKSAIKEEDKAEYYILMDKLEHMVLENRVSAVEAVELLDRGFKELG